jgi:hypothetical protein
MTIRPTPANTPVGSGNASKLINDCGEEGMNDDLGTSVNSRTLTIDILQRFEQAAESMRNWRTEYGWSEAVAGLREATEHLRHHLALHLAPRELMDWRPLPDHDQEVTAFAYELKMEHADLLRELADLLQEMELLHRALDRSEAAMELQLKCQALARRVARHAAAEDAPLGRYAT